MEIKKAYVKDEAIWIRAEIDGKEIDIAMSEEIEEKLVEIISEKHALYDYDSWAENADCTELCRPY